MEGDEQNLNYLRLYLHHCSSSLSNFKSKLYLKTCPQHLLQSAQLFVHRSRKRPPPHLRPCPSHTHIPVLLQDKTCLTGSSEPSSTYLYAPATHTTIRGGPFRASTSSQLRRPQDWNLPQADFASWHATYRCQCSWQIPCSGLFEKPSHLTESKKKNHPESSLQVSISSHQSLLHSK